MTLLELKSQRNITTLVFNPIPNSTLLWSQHGLLIGEDSKDAFLKGESFSLIEKESKKGTKYHIIAFDKIKEGGFSCNMS
jgi:hypothetical protein